MTPDDIQKYSAEFVAMLTSATASLTTIQGIEIGFFDRLSIDEPVTAEELSGRMGYDIARVERWLNFGIAAGYLAKSPRGYTLTPKGMILSKNTPVPDLLGLHVLVGYFTHAIQHSRDLYQRGIGLDSLTKGKMSRDYIPRVASQLSKAAAEFFHAAGLAPGHTILDLGCGNASLLRETIKVCPGVSATGVDINPHTLDVARRRNAELGLQDQIELQQGDITDLTRFRDGSFDWVCSFNVFHYLPANKRAPFLREMIRISRYGAFFNQVITNTLGTYAVDVLLSTMFTDYTGFFTTAEADALLAAVGVKHSIIQPIVHGESRLVTLYTKKADSALGRVPGMNDMTVAALKKIGITTALGLLTADRSTLPKALENPDALIASAKKLLFP